MLRTIFDQGSFEKKAAEYGRTPNASRGSYGDCYSFRFMSVTAPNEAEVTALAYLARTPRV